MIVRPRPNIFTMLFIVRGSIIPHIASALILLMAFSFLIVLLHERHIVVLPEFSLAPFTLLGIALSLFLGFRNNAAYDRWWEARKQWGEMVYEIRSIARSSETLLGLQAEQGEAGELRRQILHWCAAHCHAMRAFLRQENCRESMLEWLDEASVNRALAHKNPADYCLRRAGRCVGELYRKGHIDIMGLRILDAHLSNLSCVQAACERISRTPIPFAYTLLTHHTTFLYCYTLPFALVPAFGYYTIFFTLLVAYTFLGLDVLAQELEGPFGREANDLPLDAMCRINEISIAESLGRVPPPELTPKDYVLE